MFGQHRQAQIVIDDLFSESLESSLCKLFQTEWGIRKYYLPKDEWLPYCQRRRDIFPNATTWRFSNKPFKKAVRDLELA